MKVKTALKENNFKKISIFNHIQIMISTSAIPHFLSVNLDFLDHKA